MLNLVGRALDVAGTRYVRLDGSVPAAARAKLLVDFGSTADDSPTVFLVRDVMCLLQAYSFSLYL
jgi:SWI/SNF-related matrix-associated actin-dependent regulator of chromatin subfamily A3